MSRYIYYCCFNKSLTLNCDHINYIYINYIYIFITHYYHLKYVKVTSNIYFFKDIDVRMMYCVEIEVILFIYFIIYLYASYDQKRVSANRARTPIFAQKRLRKIQF